VTTDESDTAQGVVFPVVDGRRSSLATGRAVFADAVSRVDTALATGFLREPSWHKNYHHHIRTLTHLSARSAVYSSRIARDGLDAATRRMRFVRGRDEMDLATGMSVADPDRFATATVSGGDGQGRPPALAVPYRGALLEGDALRRQLQTWQTKGIVEPGFATALTAVIDHPEWSDLSDLSFVLLGAGAELSPLVALLRRGATVAAIDVPRPQLWQRLIREGRRNPGRLSFPVRRSEAVDRSDDQLADHAGLDLVTDAPEAARWIGALPGPFTLGSYIYTPGADHVRATVAVDAVIRRLSARRSDLGLAFLATPTDVYAVPIEAVEMSLARYHSRSAAAIALAGLSAHRLFRPQYEGTEIAVDGDAFGLSDVLVEQQGPNYALAMRLQRWRAMDARVHGVGVSVNVAPPTSTRSVVRNRLLAMAYRGAAGFGVEIFEPATTRALMAALLVHDLRNPESYAHAEVPLEQDWRMFTHGANHGGLWRVAYEPRSVLTMAVARGALSRG